MTGSDIDSNFHLLWQYANGSLPPDQFEACIESAKVGFDKLLEEIKAPQDRAVADYHGSRWNIDTIILTCASCGIRHQEDLLGGRLFSSDELGLLKYMDATVVLDKERRARILAAKEHGAVFSYYRRPNKEGGREGIEKGDLWHLHPEYVEPTSDGGFKARLCGECASFVDSFNAEVAKKKGACVDLPESWRSKVTVAGGKDFGDIRRHPNYAKDFSQLTEADWQAVSPARLFGVLYKVSGANGGSGLQRTLRGNLIAFRQQAVAAVSPYAFPDIDLHERVSLMFVGPRGQFERMKLAALPFGKAVSSFDPEKYEKLLKATQMFKALGWPEYALAPDFSEYEAHRKGAVTPNAAAFARGEAYFNGDRDQHGSFLNELYEAATVEDDKVVVQVDVISHDSDPAQALPQANEDRGPGPPDIAPDYEVIYEPVLIGERLASRPTKNGVPADGSKVRWALHPAETRAASCGPSTCQQPNLTQLQKQRCQMSPG